MPAGMLVAEDESETIVPATVETWVEEDVIARWRQRAAALDDMRAAALAVDKP